jgi:predicted enzyme related to lactoylglutathione lyase
MESNPVGWFEIYVQDMARAKQFYETVFGAKLEKLPTPDLEMWAFPMALDRMGAAGALVKNSVLVYFSCADCATEVERVRAAGGRIQKEKTSIGEYGFIALAFDTEGNMIGLHSRQ